MKNHLLQKAMDQIFKPGTKYDDLTPEEKEEVHWVMEIIRERNEK